MPTSTCRTSSSSRRDGQPDTPAIEFPVSQSGRRACPDQPELPRASHDLAGGHDPSRPRCPNSVLPSRMAGLSRHPSAREAMTWRAGRQWQALTLSLSRTRTSPPSWPMPCCAIDSQQPPRGRGGRPAPSRTPGGWSPHTTPAPMPSMSRGVETSRRSPASLLESPESTEAIRKAVRAAPLRPWTWPTCASRSCGPTPAPAPRSRTPGGQPPRSHAHWAPVLDELLGDNLLHQGSCYSATAPAIPFLARLATSGALPARRRLDLYSWLLIAADRHAESLIDDADRAAVHDGVPQAAAWTDDVHTAVGEQVPALLAQWATEPEATRFVLAALAALYPDQSSHLVGDITAAVQGHQGTQAGAYLQLAAALLANDSDEVLALAQDIVAWDDEIEADWLEAPGVSTTTRCGHVLAQGTLGQLNNLEE